MLRRKNEEYNDLKSSDSTTILRLCLTYSKVRIFNHSQSIHKIEIIQEFKDHSYNLTTWVFKAHSKTNSQVFWMLTRKPNSQVF